MRAGYTLNDTTAASGRFPKDSQATFVRPYGQKGARATWRGLAVLAACVAALPGQTPPASTVVVDTANRVAYQYDNYDVTKFGTNNGIVAPQNIRSPHPFLEEVSYADVVAVNGKPAKGTMVIKSIVSINMDPVPGPGKAIADITRGGMGHSVWEIQTADGRAVGTVITTWLSGGTPPPGAPSTCTAGNQGVVGGTGAFLGVSGMVCQASAPMVGASRTASVQEDPAGRRRGPGGTNRYVMQLISRYVPEVMVEAGQPAVFHADFSLVTAGAPARPGERLILMATGLGPTIPALEPGEVFKQDALQPVSAPVEVVFNGQAVETSNTVGWPGTADRFRVDFTVPDGTAAGAATLRLSAAWIQGATVRISVGR